MESDDTVSFDSEDDLLLAFDTDDALFVRGVEVGQAWERARAGQPFEMTVHASNVEMMLRIADATSLPIVGHDLGGDWVSVQFG